jgi:two-component sensor histidine kinase
MVSHELATNAFKYGALSQSGGSIQVSWTILEKDPPERRLRVTWIERGGPPVTPPDAPGFGTGFITRSVQYELGGTATLDFAPAGVECTIEFPFAGKLQTPPPGDST